MALISRRNLLVASAAVAVTAHAPVSAKFGSSPPMRMLNVNGVRLAVHDVGSGPVVMLLHGFPGLAFTWRHQIPALVSAGYRVLAPDLRGYGRSEAPEEVEAYGIEHLTGDLVGILDALNISKAIFMGHDWGGLLAWQMPLLHASRVEGVVSVNTPYIPHWMLWLHPDLVEAALPPGRTFVANPLSDPIEQMRHVYGSDMYVLLFQSGPEADVAMAQDVRSTLRHSYRKNLITSAEWHKLPREVANMAYYGQPIPRQPPGRDVLADWELEFYTAAFKQTGFTPAINWYRNLAHNWQTGLKVEQSVRVPALMISGEHDVVLRPSMTAAMGRYVPDLERHVIAGSWHWVPEEKPDTLNRLVTSWLRRRFPAGA